MMNSKIKAATIFEIVITMVISAIIITMTYSAFSMFSRLYHTVGKSNNANADLLRFDSRFKKDIEQAAIILKSYDGLKLYSASDTIEYALNDNYILRNRNNLTDTFKIVLTRRLLQFNGEEQHIENRPVDKIEFDYSMDENLPVKLVYSRQYAADIYINLEDQAWQE